ncbi:MAG: DUF2062 domain-containing protein [Gammaproteobacteria bacterium]|nr:DUF2062 domain-containing protein [Gammaproteobacteria bacterium]
MPRRFFRKFAIKRHHMAENRLLSPFRNLLHEPRLWGIRRRTVVPAFALGLFIAFLPFPGHPLWAALLALTLRINIPVAIVTTFVSNPLTMGPMYYSTYRLGRRLLGLEPVPFSFELSLDWVTNKFVTIWQPMILGSLLLGTAAALIGYVIVDLLWRASVHDYKSRKRQQRNDSTSD